LTNLEWLKFILNPLSEHYSPNIYLRVAHFMENSFQNLDAGYAQKPFLNGADIEMQPGILSWHLYVPDFNTGEIHKADLPVNALYK